jgi:hypothetical protein
MRNLTTALLFTVALSAAAFAGEQVFSNHDTESRTGSPNGTIYPSGSGVFMDFVPEGGGDTTTWFWNPTTERYDLLDENMNRTSTSVELGVGPS